MYSKKSLCVFIITLLVPPTRCFSSNIYDLSKVHKEEQNKKSNIDALFAPRDQEKKGYANKLIAESKYKQIKNERKKLIREIRYENSMGKNQEKIAKLKKKDKNLAKELKKIEKQIEEKVEEKYPGSGMKGFFQDWKKGNAEFFENLDKKIEEKIDQEKKEHEAKMKKEKEEHETEMKKKRQEHEARMKKEREEYEVRMKKKREEYEVRMKKEKEEHEAEMKKKREEHEVKMKKEKEEDEAEMKKKREKREAKMKKKYLSNLSISSDEESTNLMPQITPQNNNTTNEKKNLISPVTMLTGTLGTVGTSLGLVQGDPRVSLIGMVLLGCSTALHSITKKNNKQENEKKTKKN